MEIWHPHSAANRYSTDSEFSFCFLSLREAFHGRRMRRFGQCHSVALARTAGSGDGLWRGRHGRHQRPGPADQDGDGAHRLTAAGFRQINGLAS